MRTGSARPIRSWNASSFDYLEVVDITGMEEYGADLVGADDFFAEWSSYVDQSRSAAVFGDIIE